MRIADLCLIFAAVFCCSLLLLAPMPHGKEYLIIYDNGRMVEQIALTKSLVLSRKFPHNEILIINGCVSMIHADCPDQNCVKAGTICKSGQIIACLPNKLSFRIITEEAEIDDVAK